MVSLPSFTSGSAPFWHFSGISDPRDEVPCFQDEPRAVVAATTAASPSASSVARTAFRIASNVPHEDWPARRPADERGQAVLPLARPHQGRPRALLPRRRGPGAAAP